MSKGDIIPRKNSFTLDVTLFITLYIEVALDIREQNVSSFELYQYIPVPGITPEKLSEGWKFTVA